MSDQKITRRGFLPATAAAFTIVPRHVLGAGYDAPSDKLNLAAVGVGGMGQNYVQGSPTTRMPASGSPRLTGRAGRCRSSGEMT